MTHSNKFLILTKPPSFFIEGLRKMGFEPVVITRPDYKEVLSIISDFHGLLIRSGMVADAGLLAKANRLKYILRPGSGLDMIDLERAKQKGICVLNSPEGNANAVGEHALGMLLSVYKRISFSFQEVGELKWDRDKNTGEELKDKTIAVVGYGHTGSAFVRKLTSMGMKILVYDKYKSGFQMPGIKECSLNDIYEKADIVSFHIPLDKSTENMIDHSYIDRFRKKITLINTSRGKILKTKDLLEAVNSGKINYACLDVLENEDFGQLTPNEEKRYQELLSTAKILITPHIAGKTRESEKLIFSILLEKLKTETKN